ncbi:MAG TPA: ATP-binding protein [Acidobacteriaceae bacterium]|jgi:PAS domain S-box-containing protein
MSNRDQANILMVDDQPGKLLSYEVILQELGENILKARSAREALDYLLRNDVAVVLMDVSMPEIDGFELADMMHQHPRFQKTAIIFISAVHLTDLDRIKGYERGAVDYISVPVVPELLRAKVSVFTELHRKTRQLEHLNRELERRVDERTEEIQNLNRQLEQRVAELETIMQVLPVGVAVSQDPECQVIMANATLDKMIGSAPAEGLLSGRSNAAKQVEIYQQGKKIQASELPLHRSARTGKSFGSVELEIRRPEGPATHLLASAIPLFREDGGVRGAVGAFFDVTSRKELENLLRERADLLELANEAIMVRSIDGVIQYWNSGAEELYGWSREEAIGKNAFDLLQTTIRNSICCEGLAEALACEGKWHGDLAHVTRTGRQVIVASRQALKADGNAILEIDRDITMQLRAEEALRKAERLAAMGRVAGIIAHEINNPLEAIINTFYLLSDHPSLDEEARYYAQLGEEELLRVSHITRQTLGFYRESKDPVDVSLPRLLDDILDLQLRRLELGNITLDKEYATNGTIQGFPVELKQVFLNLIGNAMQAMPDGGKLRLRVAKWYPRGNRAGGVCVSIIDTGSGIAPEQAQHLFEPFFTTKSTKGTGLGLWISKGIVQKYGGTIRFRSVRQAAGNITCFRVFFPDPQTPAYADSHLTADGQGVYLELARSSSGHE